MILADKITEERKKNGWSQEELANQLGVSRQAVSKWESAGAVPDLQRILQMSELFGVSTDYLLKDEMQAENITYHESTESYAEPLKKVTMENANEFLDMKRNGSKIQRKTKPLSAAKKRTSKCGGPKVMKTTFPPPAGYKKRTRCNALFRIFKIRLKAF